MPLIVGSRVTITLHLPDGTPTRSGTFEAVVVHVADERVLVDYKDPQTGDWKLTRLLENPV
ncbi:MAG TPA: hypothetical protein VHP58_00720 [Alphaproteobacteria bacterium]|nr:hypothetical protein [Alphaproteobacteria bacterium]